MPTQPSWPLRTERLALRRYRSDDVGWMASLYARPDVARFLLEDPWTPQQAQENLTKRMTKNGLEGPSGALSLTIDKGEQSIGDVSVGSVRRRI